MTPVIRIWAVGLVLATVLLASQGVWALEATEGSAGPTELRGKPHGPWAKAGGALRGVVAEFEAHRDRGIPEPFEPSNPTLQHRRGRVVIDAVAADDGEALLQDLRRFGLRDAARYGSVVSGSIPIGAVRRVIELNSLRSIAASRKPLTNVGAVTSEGVQAVYADSVQSDGLTGTGVMVGVLSDSFDQQGGYGDAVTSGDLPPDITVLDDTADCGDPCSDEGRGMLELIYDMAPGSDLAFHTAFGGMAHFANGIEDLGAAGADIIVDDVIYFAEPMFQDGIIAQAVDTVVGQNVAYFSSAGNFARKSYETAYAASNEILTVNGAFRGELHDFDPGAGVDWDQGFTLPDLADGSIVSLVLQWDQPFASVSSGRRGSESDVDVYILDDGSNVLAKSIDDNVSSGEPIEIMQFQVPPCDPALVLIFGIGCVPDNASHRLLISLFGGPPPGKLKYILFQRDIALEYATHSSTLFGHANAAGAEAVGAAFYQATPPFCDNGDAVTYNDCELNAVGADTATLEPFSSAGGTATLFDSRGRRLSSPEIRLKPEVVGPDGTNTTFFFSDSSRDADDWPNFFGTSASAPHVAGVAALMLEGNPALAPAEIYAALEGTALDMNPRPEGPAEAPDGFDHDTGWGLVQADQAVAAVTTGTGNSPPVAEFSFACVDLACSFDGSGSSDGDGSISSYDWDFGDGGTDSGATVSHSYAGGGTYPVTLTVTDDAGATDSASQQVTVSGPTTASGMHVGDLDGSSTNQGRSWTANVTITVHDADEIAVSGATVSGLLSDGASASNVSCTTDAAGRCTVSVGGIRKRNGTATFSVSDVIHATLTYSGGADNHDPDGDSDGTSITVAKP